MRYLKLLSLLLFVVFQFVTAQDKHAEAEQIFKKYLVKEERTVAKMIINLDDSVYVYYCKGVMADNKKDKIKNFMRFISLQPKYGAARAFLNLGLLYADTNKKDSALFYYNIAHLKDSTLINTYIHRGDLLFSMERCDEATKDFNMIIKMLPDYEEAYLLRGICKMNAKNLEHALADFNKVIELNPSNSQAYMMRGVVYRDQKDYLIAIENWKKAKKISPVNEKVANMMIKEVKALIKAEKKKR